VQTVIFFWPKISNSNQKAIILFHLNMLHLFNAFSFYRHNGQLQRTFSLLAGGAKTGLVVVLAKQKHQHQLPANGPLLGPV
jgi:hypothetical protein